jgi:predicted metal-dependent phosphoesterase TrpH
MKADLHVHSTHSDDGRQTVEELLRRCEELGIGAVAITDHNTLQAHLNGGPVSKIIVVPAMEITTEQGHVLALGIREEVPRGLSVVETVERIHRAGGIAVAPHPFRWFSGLGESNVRGNDFDAIEVFNGRSKKGVNARARRLAKKMALPGVGGSDAHNDRSIGRVYTEVPDDCRTYQDIIRAIKDRRCKAVGTNLTPSQSLGRGARSLTTWFGRGFKRM